MSVKHGDAIQAHSSRVTLTFDLFDPKSITYKGTTRSSRRVPDFAFYGLTYRAELELHI